MLVSLSFAERRKNLGEAEMIIRSFRPRKLSKSVGTGSALFLNVEILLLFVLAVMLYVLNSSCKLTKGLRVRKQGFNRGSSLVSAIKQERGFVAF